MTVNSKLEKPVSPTPQVVSANPETYLYFLTSPLRTKCITSGTLSALAEFLATYLAGEKSPSGSYFTDRIPKMAIYGSLISAPLGHVMVTLLQRAFAGRTTTRDKILQIIASNTLISPITNSVYLASMAIIAGARTLQQVKATVKAGFIPVMKVSLITSPLTMAIAQKYLAPHAWVPFFNLVGFVVSVYINTMTKRRRQALARKQLSDDEKPKTT